MSSRIPASSLDSTKPSKRLSPNQHRTDLPFHDTEIEASRNAIRLLGRRATAGLVDAFLLLSIDSMVVYLTLRLAGLPMVALDRLPFMPLVTFLCLFNVGYVVAMTASGGQTIGKIVTGLRVESRDGSSVGIVGALVRTFAYSISVLPVGLGFAGIFFRPGRALHDVFAGTRVVAAPSRSGHTA